MNEGKPHHNTSYNLYKKELLFYDDVFMALIGMGTIFIAELVAAWDAFLEKGGSFEQNFEGRHIWILGGRKL